MTDRLKIALNRLQLYIDKNADETLLIFENEWSLDNFVQSIRRDQGVTNDYLEDKILITMEDLVWNNGLTSLRFREYRFMPL